MIVARQCIVTGDPSAISAEMGFLSCCANSCPHNGSASVSGNGVATRRSLCIDVARRNSASTAIAGGSLAGILYAILFGADLLRPFQVVGEMLPALRGDEALGQIAGAALFFGLAVILARFGQRKI